MKKITITLSLFAGLLLTTGCASAPKSGVEKISSTANPSDEITITEKTLTSLKAEQVDVLATQDYEKAVKYLDKAKDQRADNAKNEKVLDSIALSRAWAREAHRKAMDKSLLGEAANNLTIAEKEGAKKNAPKTFAYANSKFDAARESIRRNPNDTSIHETLAREATQESARLLRINRESKAYEKMKPEEIALQVEEQKHNLQKLRNVSNLQERQISHEKAQVANLEQQQAVIDKADKIRESFKPNEATVLTEGDKVILRLKGLNFASNQSTIAEKNYPLLKKVQDSLQEFPDSKVVVEGHTDAIGSANLNKVLSEKRAQAVGDYLTAQKAIDNDNLEIVGSGFDNPISENKTAAGRAQNRRIDIIIEPMVQ